MSEIRTYVCPVSQTGRPVFGHLLYSEVPKSKLVRISVRRHYFGLQTFQNAEIRTQHPSDIGRSVPALHCTWGMDFWHMFVQHVSEIQTFCLNFMHLMCLKTERTKVCISVI